MLRQRPACSRHRSYVRLISAVYMATNQLTLLWPSHRPPPPKIAATILSKNLCCFWHRSWSTPCLPEAVRPLTRRLGERRKSINVWINSETKVEKTLALLLSPALTAGLKKTCPRLRTLNITRKGNTRRTGLNY